MNSELCKRYMLTDMFINVHGYGIYPALQDLLVLF